MPGNRLTGVCHSRRSACLYRTAVPVSPVEAAGNLIDAEKATLAKVDERSAEMADDNPAD